MSIMNFLFHKTNKTTCTHKQKKSIKPTIKELKDLGENPSVEDVRKIFARSYQILNNVELQNADYSPTMFAEFDDGDYTPDILIDARGEYGRCPDNPIPVNGPTSQVTYLSRLLTIDSKQRVVFHRLGSTTSKVLNIIVDTFEVVSIDGKDYDILYLDMYHLGQSKKAPSGYLLQEKLDGITGTSIGISNKFPTNIKQDAFQYACSVFGAPVVSPVINKLNQERAKNLIETKKSSS